MLWTTLVLWSVVCLTGSFAKEFDFMYWYQARRKDNSLNSEDDNEYTDAIYPDDYPELVEHEDHSEGSFFRAETINTTDNKQETADSKSEDNKRRQIPQYQARVNLYTDNYLAHIKLNLYNRHQKVQIIKASNWFPNFDYNKDLVILVHGALVDKIYPEDFFNTLANALLHHADYNVIGIDWRHFLVPERGVFENQRNTEEAVKIGHLLNTVVDRALSKSFPMQMPRTIYIGQGLGCIPVVVQSSTYGFMFDSVYGLSARHSFGTFNHLTLTQKHGRLVHTFAEYDYPFFLSHRDYKIILAPGVYAGDYNFLTYNVLSEAIIYGNITARYCSSEGDYIEGLCSNLPTVPMWYRHMTYDCGYPNGRYYFDYPARKPDPYSGGLTHPGK